ncbi:Hypothetical protein PBC10988_24920 [Planctomycetales bacterium 10988]|nr:Hypothetical protein PBC10988_24920 [Planctomycetales bacterium 10988]
MEYESLPCYRISKEEAERYIDTGYWNPVYTDNYTEEDNIDEWLLLYEIIRQNLARELNVPIKSTEEEQTFYMFWEPDPSRLLCVEVISSRMLDRGVLRRIHSIIKSYNPSYAIDVCSARGFFEIEPGKDGPDFYILIEKDRIFVYAEEDIILEQFQLKPLKFLNKYDEVV